MYYAESLHPLHLATNSAASIDKSLRASGVSVSCGGTPAGATTPADHRLNNLSAPGPVPVPPGHPSPHFISIIPAYTEQPTLFEVLFTRLEEKAICAACQDYFFLLTFKQLSKTCSESAKSMGVNLLMMPSFSISCAQLSGASSTTDFTPSSWAFSKMKRFPL